jgi:putative protease
MQLRNGDGFSFISKDHNSIVGFRGDMCKGSMIQCKPVPELYPGARLYRNLDTAFEREMESNLPSRRIPVEVTISILSNCPPYRIIVSAESQDGRVVSFEYDAGISAAGNRGRMEALFKSQIGKVTGIYSFNLKELDIRTEDGSLPFMPASALNGIRREVAERLDAISCKTIPMGPSTASAGSATDRPETITYKANVANGVAERTYRKFGTDNVEKAFELTHRKDAELMRSKYCIRHELGLCPFGERSAVVSLSNDRTTGNLFLVNNGRRYQLGFDCAACEMTVKG